MLFGNNWYHLHKFLKSQRQWDSLHVHCLLRSRSEKLYFTFSSSWTYRWPLSPYCPQCSLWRWEAWLNCQHYRGMRLACPFTIIPLNLGKKIPELFWPRPFSWSKAFLEPKVHGYPQPASLPQHHSSHTWTPEFPAKSGPEPTSRTRADYFPGPFILRADQATPMNRILLGPRSGQERPVYVDVDDTLYLPIGWGIHTYAHESTHGTGQSQSEKKRGSQSMD